MCRSAAVIPRRVRNIVDVWLSEASERHIGRSLRKISENVILLTKSDKHKYMIIYSFHVNPPPCCLHPPVQAATMQIS